MYKSERILNAIGYLDEAIIEGVDLAKPSGSHTRSLRRAGSVLLVAALLTVLFSATAYAQGWFGLSARVTAETSGGYISFNGYANTPEGKASAEWAEFLRHHESPLSPEESRAWDETHRDDPAVFYGVWDDDALEALHQVAERYHLKLHTARVTPWTEELFYQITGLAPFLTDPEAFSVLYVYEDGSFSAEAELADGWIRLDRGARGVLCPSVFYLRDTEHYEEWQATSAEGVVLNFAQDRDLDEFDGYQGWIFCESGDYLITLQYRVPQGKTTHSAAEALAEQISFAGLGQGRANLTPALAVKPTEARAERGLLTVEALVNTPEYRASTAFQQAYNDWYDENGAIARSMRGNGYVAGQYDKGYYGSFPCGKGDLDARLQALAEEYDLQAPVSSRAIMNGAWINPEALLATMWSEGTVEAYRTATAADGWALIGCEPFLDYDPLTFILWDNGAWQVDMLSYVPYGSLHPALQAIQDPSARSWPYNTASGVQVLLCECGAAPYPLIPESHILYDTGSGYLILTGGSGNVPNQAALLEQQADRIDFSKIP